MRILVVYAHPDDESFGPSAVLAKYARQGAKIYGLVATRGEHGNTDLTPKPSPEELGRLRERDLRDAAAVIGFTHLEILGYEDGTLGEVPLREFEEQILAAIRRYHPKVMITFGPAGITRHPDHLAIHRAAVAAFYRALAEGLGVRELYYDAVPPERAREMGLEGLPAGHPNTFVDVSETYPVKIAALRLHGRHIVDAREMAERLEREPQMVATLYRAWPEVNAGERVTGFLQNEARVLLTEGQRRGDTETRSGNRRTRNEKRETRDAK